MNAMGFHLPASPHIKTSSVQKVPVRNTAKLLRRMFGSLVLVTAVAGCSPEMPQSPGSKSAELTFHDAPLSAALTDREIESFLAVMSKLPGSEDAFGSFEQPLPRLDRDAPLRQAIEQLRTTYREQLQPAALASNWVPSPKLHSVLKEHRINPGAFTGMLLRLSSAWSAANLSRHQPVASLQERLQKQIQECRLRCEHPSFKTTGWEREQLLSALEEAVILSEFLHLMEQIPPASLEAVARHETQLRRVLPDPDQSPGPFVRQVTPEAHIIPVGGTSR